MGVLAVIKKTPVWIVLSVGLLLMAGLMNKSRHRLIRGSDDLNRF
jgi:hypothetical protein